MRAPQPRRLILASASPRRRELLSLLRLPFDVIVSDVSEEELDERPVVTAARLARSKAEAVAGQLGEIPGIVVIGADTVVSVDVPDPVSLAKPADADEARKMLRTLSGRTHTVFTGIHMAWRPPFVGGECRQLPRVVETDVTFRELSDAVIDAYIATGEPFDKAGAYGIQGYACSFVEAIYGDYFNIVGLPVATVARMLEEIGVEWWRGPEALSI